MSADPEVTREETPVYKRPWCLCPLGHWWLGWPHVVNVCTECSQASQSEHDTPGALTAAMERTDRTLLDLKGARERLCRAQVRVPHHWRKDLDDAIAVIDAVGSSVFPYAWSEHDQPEYPEAGRG